MIYRPCRVFRYLELRAFTFVHGWENVHHCGVLHHLHLHRGDLPNDVEAFPPRLLQHGRSHRVYFISTNAFTSKSMDKCVFHACEEKERRPCVYL